MTLLVVLGAWVLGSCAFAALLGALLHAARVPDVDLPLTLDIPALPTPRDHTDERWRVS